MNIPGRAETFPLDGDGNYHQLDKCEFLPDSLTQGPLHTMQVAPSLFAGQSGRSEFDKWVLSPPPIGSRMVCAGSNKQPSRREGSKGAEVPCVSLWGFAQLGIITPV